jgi:hypothetical protein
VDGGLSLKSLGRRGKFTKDRTKRKQILPSGQNLCQPKRPAEDQQCDGERGRHGREDAAQVADDEIRPIGGAKRILQRLHGGFGYDEIAQEEKLTERRVTEALEGRPAPESAIHAHMQIVRLGRAAPVAGEALSRGDIRAVARVITRAVGSANKPSVDMGGVIRRENRVPPGGFCNRNYSPPCGKLTHGSREGFPAGGESDSREV